MADYKCNPVINYLDYAPFDQLNEPGATALARVNISVRRPWSRSGTRFRPRIVTSTPLPRGRIRWRLIVTDQQPR